MHGQLTPAGMRVVRSAQGSEEDFQRGHPQRQRDAHVPVVRPGVVLPRAHGQRTRDLRYFMASGSEHEAGSALSVEGPEPLIQPPGPHRELVDASEQFPLIVTNTLAVVHWDRPYCLALRSRSRRTAAPNCVRHLGAWRASLSQSFSRKRAPQEWAGKPN